MKFTKRAAPTSEGIGAANYLKIGDGQSATGVPRGEVHEFYQRWPQGGTKEIFDVPTAGASARFRINVVVNEDGKPAAKVFEFGMSVYNQLAEISENFEITKTKLKISRKGSGKNTEWFILPLGPVEAKALKAIEAVELNALAPQSAGAASGELEVETADEELGF